MVKYIPQYAAVTQTLLTVKYVTTNVTQVTKLKVLDQTNVTMAFGNLPFQHV